MSKSQSVGRIARKKARNELKRAANRAALDEHEQQQKLSRLPSSGPRLPSLPTTHGSFPAPHRTTTATSLIH
jgi:hypothetical protein